MLLAGHIKQLQSEIAQEEPWPAVFNALSDTGRFRIFKLLMVHRDLCVTDIAHVMGISVPAASQQLKVLELSGLVKPERQGQKICYCLRTKNPVVKAVMRLVRRAV